MSKYMSKYVWYPYTKYGFCINILKYIYIHLTRVFLNFSLQEKKKKYKPTARYREIYADVYGPCNPEFRLFFHMCKDIYTNKTIFKGFWHIFVICATSSLSSKKYCGLRQYSWAYVFLFLFPFFHPTRYNVCKRTRNGRGLFIDIKNLILNLVTETLYISGRIWLYWSIKTRRDTQKYVKQSLSR